MAKRPFTTQQFLNVLRETYADNRLELVKDHPEHPLHFLNTLDEALDWARVNYLSHRKTYREYHDKIEEILCKTFCTAMQIYALRALRDPLKYLNATATFGECHYEMRSAVLDVEYFTLTIKAEINVEIPSKNMRGTIDLHDMITPSSLGDANLELSFDHLDNNLSDAIKAIQAQMEDQK